MVQVFMEILAKAGFAAILIIEFPLIHGMFLHVSPFFRGFL
jgi:hypothetical protein